MVKSDAFLRRLSKVQNRSSKYKPILHEEVEIAVASLKRGKSAGVENTPAEFVQAGGETSITGSGEQDEWQQRNMVQNNSRRRQGCLL